MPRPSITSIVSPALQATRRRRTRRSISASGAGRGVAAAHGSTIRYPAPCTVDDARAGLGPELRAEQVDVRLHRVVRHVVAEGPGIVEQLVTAEDLAGVAQEALEERELPPGELDDMPATSTRRSRWSRRIGPFGELLVDLVMARRASVEGAQPRHELLVGERLDQVVVGAGVEPAPRDRPSRRGRSASGSGRRCPAAAEAPRYLDPGDVGQSDVEDHGLDPDPRCDDLDGIEPMLGHLDDVAVALQHPAQGAAEASVILDHQQAHRPSLRPRF